ncbi:cell wall metabolism sensor histidine kinase WalK [Sporosarcina sp. HYO08]|uniref:sensor histidine kinase n=1 Tax=Sporosarcina sp. HYO08 TaxID=1759557 RepID=UPI0007912206|nr:HAMP domain-containing sensor histidine kinase [Sporosarcina sp. HYO08]KXH87097.1 histidine kinase [Sporosarcina sp. HYO08]
MRRIKFGTKMLLSLVAIIGCTVIFSFFFIHFLYSRLYLSTIEESILYQGSQLVMLSQHDTSLIESSDPIQWHNSMTEYEILQLNHLEELPALFPDILNDQDLLKDTIVKQLEKESYAFVEGFLNENKQEVLGAVFPIEKQGATAGYYFIFTTLASIPNAFRESLPLLVAFGILFFFILFLVLNRIWYSILGPLQELQTLSNEVSRGNYSSRIQTDRDDEIGKVMKAFNSMSYSLEQQEERKKEFSSNVVHELRTPLTYISGYTHVLKDKIHSSPNEADSYLTTIEKEAERLGKLINDLAELNHLQEDMYVIDRQPIALAQLFLDTLDLFKIHIAEKKLRLALSVEEDLIVMGDPKRVQQVFYNLLDNAIKYSSIGGILAIVLKEEHSFVEFKVRNEGIHIQQEDLARIGERFFRTDKARTRTTGGTGLGLSIVKEIIRLHDGTFSISSDSKIGTIITVKLPAMEWDEKG